MSPEQQRIAIAEACGWTKVHWYEDNAGPPILSGIPPTTEEQALGMSQEAFRQRKEHGATVPEYLHDLNAMHEAEEWITGESERGYRYDMMLFMVTRANEEGQTNYMRLWHATAAQRAEAFLRTIGKYTEPPTTNDEL